jgi:hypothetical protein
LNPAAGAPGVVIITYFTQSGLPTNYTATAPLSMTGTTLSIAAATTSATGVVSVPSANGLSVNGSGVLAMGLATSNAPGVVQVGSGLSVSPGGVLTSISGSAYGTFSGNTTLGNSAIFSNSYNAVGLSIASNHGITLTNGGMYFVSASGGYQGGTGNYNVAFYVAGTQQFSGGLVTGQTPGQYNDFSLNGVISATAGQVFDLWWNAAGSAIVLFQVAIVRIA